MMTLVVQEFKPGEVIFYQGSRSTEVYFIIGASDEKSLAEVEVIKLEDGKEKLMTRLSIGQYFGQIYFITKRQVSFINML